MQDGFSSDYDLFIVASYGKIIPKSVLEIPKFGALNVHPSLLPKFRGPSPIQSFILSGEEKTGVTIMLMDEEVDHGKIIAQREFEARNTKSEIRNKSQIQNLKLNSKELEEKLAELGGQMLVDAIPKWINGEIKPQEQDHSQATFTEKNKQGRRAGGFGKRQAGNDLQEISSLPVMAGGLLFYRKRREKYKSDYCRYGIPKRPPLD